MPSITSANTIFTIAIANLYPTPVQLQNYSADDILDIEAIVAAEAMMGVDGILSAGYVNNPVVQTINLMGSSNSNIVFETWYFSAKAQQDVYSATGVITYPSINRKYTMNNGYLTSIAPMSDAKKVLQPRKFVITWESCQPSAIG